MSHTAIEKANPPAGKTRRPTGRPRGGSTSSPQAGFSLIELLVVIAIIGLLAGLIVPSLGSAREQAKIARSQSLLRTIAAGVEMFNNDTAIGEEYPPSFWDTGALPGGDGGDPYGTGDGTYTAYGAQTLLWALIGADGLGTPGFRRGYLHSGTDGLYELDTSDNPMSARAPVFFEISAGNLKRPVDLELDPAFPGGNDEVLVITDVFDMPILYFRADTTQTGLDVYNRDDNAGFALDSQSNTHPLFEDTAPGGTNLPAAIIAGTAFQQFTWNPQIPTPAPHPHKRDSFLLISAGPDGLYGTDDDVCNYPLIGGKNY